MVWLLKQATKPQMVRQLNMAKITITIDGDNVTVNQSATPTKMENTTKRYFIVIGCNDENSWIELVTEDYIKAANKILDLSLIHI